jgi:hypothetical protein
MGLARLGGLRGCARSEDHKITVPSGAGIDNAKATFRIEWATPASDYVVRVINYAGAEPWSGTVTFAGPEPYKAAQQETWTLFCESPEGTIRSARQVFVDRGQRRSLDLRTDCMARR